MKRALNSYNSCFFLTLTVNTSTHPLPLELWIASSGERGQSSPPFLFATQSTNFSFSPPKNGEDIGPSQQARLDTTNKEGGKVRRESLDRALVDLPVTDNVSTIVHGTCRHRLAPLGRLRPLPQATAPVPIVEKICRREKNEARTIKITTEGSGRVHRVINRGKMKLLIALQGQGK